MNEFYYELLFELLALGIEALLFIAFYYLVRLIWAVCEVIKDRCEKCKIEKREKAERLIIYNERSAEYRKEYLKCYRQE